MEWPTGQCHRSTISAHLQKMTKCFDFHILVLFYKLLFLCVIVAVAACYLSHLNISWLIDWVSSMSQTHIDTSLPCWLLRVVILSSSYWWLLDLDVQCCSNLSMFFQLSTLLCPVPNCRTCLNSLSLSILKTRLLSLIIIPNFTEETVHKNPIFILKTRYLYIRMYPHRTNSYHLKIDIDILSSSNNTSYIKSY